MKLGVLGGTFDPIHFAHLRLAEEVREALELERVLFVPAARPPLKGGAHASDQDRLEMARLAIGDHPGFDVLDLELLRDGPSYTVDTLRDLAGRYPGAELWFVLGTDALVELHLWSRPHELVELASFAVVGREPFLAPLEQLVPESLRDAFSGSGEKLVHASGRELRRVPFTPLSISSTDVRARLGAGRSVRYLVPRAVIDYIEKHHLYQEAL